jgi:hypothetical protein
MRRIVNKDLFTHQSNGRCNTNVELPLLDTSYRRLGSTLVADDRFSRVDTPIVSLSVYHALMFPFLSLTYNSVRHPYV